MVNLHKSIIDSCDTYFYVLSYQMGIDKMNAWMRQFGFGQKQGLIYRVRVKACTQIQSGKCARVNRNGSKAKRFL